MNLNGAGGVGVMTMTCLVECDDGGGDDGWVEGDNVGGVVISVVATVGEVGCVGMVGGVGVKGVGDSSGGCVVVAGK
ncbi:hypothetical protein Tco_1399312 [Tanacetum coccineum]